MADVKPFRAARYGERAGSPETLVAPPYDVISLPGRIELAARNECNVVHLTLPASEAEAGRLWRTWLADGTLVAEDEAGFWWLSQNYVGPDGVSRTRDGIVAALRAEPYENRVILPHERTHRGPKEGRLRLLREVQAQLEPLFFLYEGAAPATRPGRAPDLEVEGARLWRLPPDGVEEAFAGRQLLIADGHHRYETALAYHAEAGTPESAYVLAVLVSLDDPGLMIFPTHRVFERAPAARLDVEEGPADPASALQALEQVPTGRAAAVLYRGGGRTELAVDGDDLDVALVDRLGHDGIAYTPDWREAVRAVDEGEAEVAVLMRATRIEDVFAVAQRGETMPQKSTYFYPKLVSGLLFLPL
ncbi:MAG TPA: DUF1015 domain-containing protein [Solirubrobacteraceae bacterium]|nr:DUF1015 domain-containing protein [Solirubrobacteraceae bacterium]